MLPISMCMIVKNEENRLKRCLESLKEYGMELIIVDTGSTDATKEVARQYNATVYDFEWCDDFSAARNFSLEKAANDWILMLDSDEIIEQMDVDELYYFMTHLKQSVGAVTRKNQITTSNGIVFSNDQTERFYNKQYYYYTGRIHEQLTPKPGVNMECLLLNTTIWHDGYDMTEEQRIQKAARNISLLEKEMEETGETPYLLYQMGKGYELCLDYEKACRFFEKALSYELDDSLAYVEALKKNYREDMEYLCEQKKQCMEEKKLLIFVATHVRFTPPNNPVYVPLHVGREGKEDLGYLGDNVGNHISDLNFLYGELTGLYWIWQNIHELDYVGLSHYRRYFLNNQGMYMNREEYLDLLMENDVLVSQHMECENSYLEHYGKAHNIHDLKAVGRAIEKLYPEYVPSFQKAMQGKIFYSGNLMVTSLPILKGYARWLFTVFAEASEEIDVSGYDNYHRRVYGFLSEQMMYVYVLKNELRIYELPVGISAEKAETTALKEELIVLVEKRKIQEAIALFQKALKERPDVLLSGSDINGELRMMYQILHLCNVEEQNNKCSLLDYSTDMKKLLECYKNILDILQRRVNTQNSEKQAAEDKNYLTQVGISDIVLDEIIRCTPSLQKS